MKQKIALVLFVQALVLSVASFILSSNAAAAAYSTKLECATNVTTITANAPSSVVTNAAFSVTNITSTSTAPNGITINKIVSTSNVSNASPSVVTGTWTGSGTGTFTVNFPDIALTTTGAAGSQAKVSLASIAIYINGNTTTPILTCNQANGQLTANKPGESLTLLSLPITAPATTPPPTTTTTTTTSPTSSSTTPKTTTSTKPTTSTTAPTTTAPASNSTPTSTSSSSPTPTQPVTITVVDASGNPVSNVPVQIDDSSPTPTNDQGTVTYLSLAPGKHKVSVLGKKTVVKTLNLNGGSDPAKLTIQMPRQMIVSPVTAVAIFGALVVGALGYWFYRRSKSRLHLHRKPKLSDDARASIVTGTNTTALPAAPVVPTPQPLPVETVPAPAPASVPAAAAVETQPIEVVQPPVLSPAAAAEQTTLATQVQPIAQQPAPPQATNPPGLSPSQQQYLSMHHATAQPGQVIAPQAPSQI